MRCLERVPADVPVGLHLCYGDYGHEHFMQPESLRMQVDLVNAVTAARGARWTASRSPCPRPATTRAYFAPLGGLRAGSDTELYFALVPYHPADQAAGHDRRPDRAHRRRAGAPGGPRVGDLHRVRDGPGRRAATCPALLDLHRQILTRRVSEAP